MKLLLEKYYLRLLFRDPWANIGIMYLRIKATLPLFVMKRNCSKLYTTSTARLT